MSNDTIKPFPDHLWQRHRWRQHTLREWKSICAVSSLGLRLLEFLKSDLLSGSFMVALHEDFGIALWLPQPRGRYRGQYVIVELLQLKRANDG